MATTSLMALRFLDQQNFVSRITSGPGALLAPAELHLTQALPSSLKITTNLGPAENQMAARLHLPPTTPERRLTLDGNDASKYLPMRLQKDDEPENDVATPMSWGSLAVEPSVLPQMNPIELHFVGMEAALRNLTETVVTLNKAPSTQELLSLLFDITAAAEALTQIDNLVAPLGEGEFEGFELEHMQLLSQFMSNLLATSAYLNENGLKETAMTREALSEFDAVLLRVSDCCSNLDPVAALAFVARGLYVLPLLDRDLPTENQLDPETRTAWNYYLASTESLAKAKAHFKSAPGVAQLPQLCSELALYLENLIRLEAALKTKNPLLRNSKWTEHVSNLLNYDLSQLAGDAFEFIAMAQSFRRVTAQEEHWQELLLALQRLEVIVSGMSVAGGYLGFQSWVVQNFEKTAKPILMKLQAAAPKVVMPLRSRSDSDPSWN